MRDVVFRQSINAAILITLFSACGKSDLPDVLPYGIGVFPKKVGIEYHERATFVDISGVASATPDTVKEYYDQMLKEKGWTLSFKELDAEKDTEAVEYSRDGKTLGVCLGRTKRQPLRTVIVLMIPKDDKAGLPGHS